MNGLRKQTLAAIFACAMRLACPISGLAAPIYGPPVASPAEQQVTYKNIRDPRGPWSIHMVRVPRKAVDIEVASVHAGNRALGLTPLTHQIHQFARIAGPVLAGVNGDFYDRKTAYEGDPRGLQIMEGELISAPGGTGSFWVDGVGEPHVGSTTSKFEITWPNGSKYSFGLNSLRRTAEMVLYTPSAGPSTRTTGGRELILEQADGSEWLPLRPGRRYRARVREVRTTGNSRIAPDTMVLSMSLNLSRSLPAVKKGDELSISTETFPNLRGVTAAISGGPVIVRDGKRQRIRATSDSYRYSSMTERHPRSAVGFDDEFIYLVEVDGRYRNVSVGMTLNELGDFMSQLGCSEALALDGGGSATLWYGGKVRNRPCDGYERPIANGLVVVKRIAGNRRSQPGALTRSESDADEAIPAAAPGEEVASDE